MIAQAGSKMGMARRHLRGGNTAGGIHFTSFEYPANQSVTTFVSNLFTVSEI
jgi:hypothetical protein